MSKAWAVFLYVLSGVKYYAAIFQGETHADSPQNVEQKCVYHPNR